MKAPVPVPGSSFRQFFIGRNGNRPFPFPSRNISIKEETMHIFKKDSYLCYFPAGKTYRLPH